MVREMIIGSTIGSLGLLSLVFGIQGTINPEGRILLPAIKTLAARKRVEQ